MDSEGPAQFIELSSNSGWLYRRPHMKHLRIPLMLIYTVKGMGVEQFLKSGEIESTPNCCIIHLTFSKCIITSALKIRADIQSNYVTSLSQSISSIL